MLSIYTMRFGPTPLQPPWSYKLSKVLTPPKANQTPREVIGRLRRFHRDGILIMGTRILWHFWNRRELTQPTTQEGIGRYITWIFAERLIALGCIYASHHNRPWPTPEEFGLLCWELHNCADTISNEAAKQRELDQIARQLQPYPPESLLARLRTVPLLRLGAEAFKSRTAASQMVGRYWDKEHLIRPYLIARDFRETAYKLGGTRYETLERQFLLTTVAGFVRAAFALLMKAEAGVFQDVPQPGGGVRRVHERGGILSSDWPANEPGLEAVGLTADDLRAVAQRLSTPLSGFADFREQLRDVDDLSLKYHHIVDWLSKHPIVDLEIGGQCHQLLVPSPWKLMAFITDFILYDFVAFLDEHSNDALAGRNAFSLRGQAFAQYLRKHLPKTPALHDIDEMEGITGQRPDFIWVGNDWGVIIEAKFSLRPNTDRALSAVSSAVESWRRAAEAVEQAAAFINANASRLATLKIHPRCWVLAVVTNEHANEEALGFRSIAREADLLRNTGLEGLCLVGVSNLEDWMAHSSPDLFGAPAARIWASTGDDPMAIEGVEREGRKDAPEPAHIQTARQELFGPASRTP
jgi:hypothetical protein